jgi:hypothetical protein
VYNHYQAFEIRLGLHSLVVVAEELLLAMRSDAPGGLSDMVRVFLLALIVCVPFCLSSEAVLRVFGVLTGQRLASGVRIANILMSLQGERPRRDLKSQGPLRKSWWVHPHAARTD